MPTDRRISGSGELAELTRQYSWEQTVLGPISTWSDALITTLNFVLGTTVSMQLLWGPDMIILYNDAFSRQIGARHPEALGQQAQVCWGDAWGIVGPQLDACFTRGETTEVSAEPVPLNLDGLVKTSYWDYAYSPIIDPAGHIVGLLDICQNVTSRVESTTALKESQDTLRAAENAFHRTEQRLKLALEAANGVGTWDWDIVADRVYADRVFAEAYGVDPGRAQTGCSIKEFLSGIAPEDRERVGVEIERAIVTGTEYVSEYRLCPRNGKERWISARGQCQLSPEGKPIRFPGVTVDISERKATEQALIRSEKLAAVGRLASSIAHEINNPLESVTNLLYILRDTAVGEQVEYLDIAERELRRVSAIANQTLRFHKQSTKPTAVTCEDLIGSALSIFQGRLVNSGIIIDKRKRAQCPVVCLEGEIRQVLSNLIGNAIDAMHDGGRLILRSREGTDWTTLRKGLKLTVADTGSGMTAEAARKAFEAFYTTKGIGGTGLGLWISKEIIERQQGRLSFRSSRDETHRGTVFTVFLPFEGVRNAASDEPS